MFLYDCFLMKKRNMHSQGIICYYAVSSVLSEFDGGGGAHVTRMNEWINTCIHV